MSESVPPLSILELDQLDIFARVQNDPFFVAGVPVLLELRGITERDIAQKIQTLNQQNGLVGSVAVVLMPTLLADSPNAPGPRYDTVYRVQVIDWPMVRRQSVGGTGISADELADRVRQILHRFTMGRGQTIYFAGQEPVNVPDGKISYSLRFKRQSQDLPPVAVASVGISPPGPGPATATLTCATAGAAIWYTTDGSYPGSNSAACPTAKLYSGPFAVAAGTTLRAAAELTGFQQSQAISQVIY
jgi:Chitobiase/beta-hexosaminidase C-terminal domain